MEIRKYKLFEVFVKLLLTPLKHTVGIYVYTHTVYKGQKF